MLRSFSIQQIFDSLVSCINKRNFGKFSMILGVVESDWPKVEQNPEEYEESLERLREDTEEGERMDVRYFQEFDLPVHPQYVVETLQKMHYSSMN